MDNFIDKLAQDSLRDYRVEYEPDDWTLMEARLDKKGPLRASPWLLKGIEFSLLALALFTFYNLQSGQGCSSDKKTGNNTIIGTSNTTAQTSATHTAIGLVSDKGTSAAQPESTLTNNAVAGTPLTTQGSASRNTTSKNATVNKPQSSIGSNKSKSSKNANSGNASQKQDATPAPTLKTAASPDEESQQVNLTATRSTDLAYNSLLSVPAFLKSPLMNDETQSLLAFKHRPKPPAPRSKRFKPVMYAGGGFSPDVTLRLPRGGTSMGFTLGALTGIQFSERLSFETGLNFSTKRYLNESTLTQISTDTATPTLFFNRKQQVSANMIEVPAQLRIDMLKHREHGFYLLAGGSFFLRGWNSYHTTGMASVNQPASGTQVVYDTYARKDAENGLFQGGNWERNYFYTLNFAFGYEYRTQSGYSLLIQPGYKHALKVSGADDERFGTFSLMIGIRRNLHN